MKSLRYLSVLLAITSAIATTSHAQQAATPLVLDDVTIVDTRAGTLRPRQSIVIRDGKISEITATRKLGRPQGARHIDLRGKYVVPGFLDMHAHPLDPAEPSLSLPLMLSYGITGYRQMGGSPALLKLKREGRLPSGNVPRALAMPGMVLAGPPVATPEGARAIVRRQHEDGADFIKAVDMPEPAFFAAMDEARRIGLPFVGHLPPSIDVRDAVRGGMKSIEHLGPHVSVLEACSSHEAAIRAQIRAIPPGGSKIAFDLPRETLERLTANPILLTPPPLYALFQQVLASYDEQKCRSLTDELVAAGNWQVPTLIREKSMQFGNDAFFRNDPRLRYVPVATRKLWSEVGDDFDRKLDRAQKAVMAQLFEREMALARLFDAAGVRMLAGSDMGGVWLIPGVSLHQEFDLLAEAGISPLHILQMTTLNGAQFLGRENDMGAVEKGKIADLVLLDGNPVTSVQNLHRISAVVLDGRYLSGATLDAIREKVAADAGKMPNASASPATHHSR